jgi:hypothetical protein
LRYWFSLEGDKSAALRFTCDYAAIGETSVSGTFVSVSPERPGADHYLDLSFPTMAGIPVGYDSGKIQLRFGTVAYSLLNQSNDYSYDAISINLTDSKKVTAYVDGKLAWGEEP